MRGLTVGLLLVVCLFTNGCVYALQPRGAPYDVKLRLDTYAPWRCRLLVATPEMPTFAVGTNGVVDVSIPSLPGGCRTFFLGRIPLSDHGPQTRRVVYVFRDAEVLKRLSIRDIEELPRNEVGERVLKIR